MYTFRRRMIVKKLALVCIVLLSVGAMVSGACPRADISGDCKVDLEDLAIMASEWLTAGSPEPAGMVLIPINYITEGFTGEMSKYETTNAQYCEFLNAALASGDITVDSSSGYVKSASGSYSGYAYYNYRGVGNTTNGATDGGASRIDWYNKVKPIGAFIVEKGFENHPVTYVTWYGATAFCDYYGYRLPTEFEWQAVADYDGNYTYGCGTSINNSIANYYNSTHPNGTTVVGSFGSYGYGMCDMAGNVSEWTDSLYIESTLIGNYYVLRGGGWSDGGTTCTVSSSNGRLTTWNPTGTTEELIGFRVCR